MMGRCLQSKDLNKGDREFTCGHRSMSEWFVSWLLNTFFCHSSSSSLIDCLIEWAQKERSREGEEEEEEKTTKEMSIWTPIDQRWSDTDCKMFKGVFIQFYFTDFLLSSLVQLSFDLKRSIAMMPKISEKRTVQLSIWFQRVSLTLFSQSERKSQMMNIWAVRRLLIKFKWINERRRRKKERENNYLSLPFRTVSFLRSFDMHLNMVRVSFVFRREEK